MKIQTLGRGFAFALTTALITACGSGAEEPGAELTRAQKDSIIADMPIPGASGVGRAMQAVDQANARTETHDTIG